MVVAVVTAVVVAAVVCCSTCWYTWLRISNVVVEAGALILVLSIEPHDDLVLLLPLLLFYRLGVSFDLFSHFGTLRQGVAIVALSRVLLYATTVLL